MDSGPPLPAAATTTTPSLPGALDGEGERVVPVGALGLGAEGEVDDAHVEVAVVAVADDPVDAGEQPAERGRAVAVGDLDVDEAGAAGRRRRRRRRGACRGRRRRGCGGSATRASSEKSGPLTTRPASEPTGEMPESTSATSVLPARTVPARMAPLTAPSVVAGVTGASSVLRSLKRRSALTERTPRRAAERLQRAARDPGGEPAHERDLTVDTVPRGPQPRARGRCRRLRPPAPRPGRGARSPKPAA